MRSLEGTGGERGIDIKDGGGDDPGAADGGDDGSGGEEGCEWRKEDWGGEVDMEGSSAPAPAPTDRLVIKINPLYHVKGGGMSSGVPVGGLPAGPRGSFPSLHELHQRKSGRGEQGRRVLLFLDRETVGISAVYHMRCSSGRYIPEDYRPIIRSC